MGTHKMAPGLTYSHIVYHVISTPLTQAPGIVSVTLKVTLQLVINLSYNYDLISLELYWLSWMVAWWLSLVDWNLRWSTNFNNWVWLTTPKGSSPCSYICSGTWISNSEHTYPFRRSYVALLFLIFTSFTTQYQLRPPFHALIFSDN